jgi:hypothetical protein
MASTRLTVRLTAGLIARLIARLIAMIGPLTTHFGPFHTDRGRRHTTQVPRTARRGEIRLRERQQGLYHDDFVSTLVSTFDERSAMVFPQYAVYDPQHRISGGTTKSTCQRPIILHSAMMDSTQQPGGSGARLRRGPVCPGQT